MQEIKTYLTLVSLLLGAIGSAQQITYAGNPDASFFTARNLAFKGHRSEARDTLHSVLTKYPDYMDVRNLLASTYSWDGEYEKARGHFNKITSTDRKNKEAWVAAIKNELYGGEFHLALGLANKALCYLPDDTDIIVLQEKAIQNAGDKRKQERESAKEENVAKDFLETKKRKNQIGLANSFELFDVVYDPMINTSIEYKRAAKVGALVPRVNYANRFNTHGVQFEMDFYPKFSKLLYGYLNYGYSNAPIFPNHRGGAELYSNWPKNMELSAGMRYLDFADAKATIYTGSIGMYQGNYYFSLRPYITPTKLKTGVSGTFLARRYLKDANNYLGVTVGMGFAPELKQLRSGDELLAETLLFIASQQVQLEYQFTGKKNPNTYKTNLGITRQELVFDSGNFFWAVLAGLTYQVKF